MREAGDDREQQPAAPEPLVDQVLGVARDRASTTVASTGRADLGVARLVGLDALHHLLEHPVADAVRQRRQPDELQVGEAGLEHEVGRDRELDRVGARAAARRPGGGRRSRPSCWCGRSCASSRTADPSAPARASAAAGSACGAARRARRTRRRPPGAVAAEARGAQVADDRRELGQRQRRGVQLQPARARPAASFWKSSTRPTASRTACDRRLLGVLARRRTRRSVVRYGSSQPAHSACGSHGRPLAPPGNASFSSTYE